MWREDRLHDWLARRPRPRALVGSAGHDGAVCRPITGRRVVCTDQTIVGVHLEPDVPARRIGHKAVARTLSDLAACAARPREVLLALSAPRERSESWMRGVISGAAACAEAHGAELVAGDLACAAGPSRLAVTAVGELGGRRRPPGRDRARAGQVLLLSGPVGGSRASRHLRPEPRLDEGRWLHERGATALMDVSDGLALDASRMAAASGVRIVLEHVPIHRDARRAARESGRTALDHALGDGEDYELIASLKASDWKRARGTAARRFPALVEIGRVCAGSGVALADADGVARVLRPGRDGGGFLHG